MRDQIQGQAPGLHRAAPSLLIFVAGATTILCSCWPSWRRCVYLYSPHQPTLPDLSTSAEKRKTPVRELELFFFSSHSDTNLHANWSKLEQTKPLSLEQQSYCWEIPCPHGRKVEELTHERQVSSRLYARRRHQEGLDVELGTAVSSLTSF